MMLELLLAGRTRRCEKGKRPLKGRSMLQGLTVEISLLLPPGSPSSRYFFCRSVTGMLANVFNAWLVPWLEGRLFVGMCSDNNWLLKGENRSGDLHWVLWRWCLRRERGNSRLGSVVAPVSHSRSWVRRRFWKEVF